MKIIENLAVFFFLSAFFLIVRWSFLLIYRLNNLHLNILNEFNPIIDVRVCITKYSWMICHELNTRPRVVPIFTYVCTAYTQRTRALNFGCVCMDGCMCVWVSRHVRLASYNRLLLTKDILDVDDFVFISYAIHS